MSQLLKTQKLTKDFGHQRGIFDVDLEVKGGEIVGFVGPNGAGKSTTINILAGLVKPDRGNVELFSKLVTTTSIYPLMPQIGLLLSETTLDEGLTAAQTFRQSQQLLNFHSDTPWQEMSEMLELDVDKQIKKLSLGNKKKVGIVNALLHQPKLVIMDEPTSGLDPIIVAKFTGLLRSVAKRGGAVLLSSHDLNEIQHLCDRVVMIRGGKVILTGSTGDLLEKASKVFILKKPGAALVKKIQAEMTDAEIEHLDDDVTVYLKDAKPMLQLLAGQKFYDFYLERPNLEQMFKEYYE
jgi:ABC-2 type transport system ATP-binding protein